MKDFKEFIQESVNIQHVDTLIVNNSQEQDQPVVEEFTADIVYQGSIHRIVMVTESGVPTRNELAEYLQGEYPGSMVHQIYTPEGRESPFKIKDAKRYHPAKLDWIEYGTVE